MKTIKAWAVMLPRSLKAVYTPSRKGYRLMTLPVTATRENAERIQGEWYEIFPNSRIVRVEIREIPKKGKAKA